MSDNRRVAQSIETLRSTFPWGVVAVLGLMCIALIISNIVRLIPYATVWGDLATWAQAVLTGGGLVFAGVSVLIGAQQLLGVRDAEEARVQEFRDVARRGLVLRSLWTARPWRPKANGLLTYEYECVNMSAFPVTNCKILIHIWTDETDRFYDFKKARESDDFYQAVVIGALAPGEAARGRVVVRNPSATLGLIETERVENPDLYFTDAWGQHWLRRGTTRHRPAVEDTPEEVAQCMCCGYLPDDRVRVGNASAGLDGPRLL